MNKTGFGYLRLPQLETEAGKVVDLDAVNALTDEFLALGGNYFDTAYTYLEGRSEDALRPYAGAGLENGARLPRAGGKRRRGDRLHHLPHVRGELSAKAAHYGASQSGGQGICITKKDARGRLFCRNTSCQRAAAGV